MAYILSAGSYEEIKSLLYQILDTSVEELNRLFCQDHQTVEENVELKKLKQVIKNIKKKKFNFIQDLYPFVDLKSNSEIDFRVKIKNFACFFLGLVYYMGLDCDRNIEKATRLWKIGAGYPSIEASCSSCLKSLLLHALIRRENEEIQLYTKKCVAKKDQLGLLLAGIFHANGLILEKNLKKSLEYLNLVRDANDIFLIGHLIETYFRLHMYTNACALAARVYDKKRDYHYKHERLMHAKSMVILSFCLSNGLGIEKDENIAKMVLEKAQSIEKHIILNLEDLEGVSQ